MSKIVKDLIELIKDNFDFYKDKDEKLCEILSELQKTINKSLDKVNRIAKIAPKYDFNEETQANGLRSFVDIFEAALTKSSDECQLLKSSRDKFLFSPSKIAGQISDCSKIIKNLLVIIEALLDVYENDEQKNSCLIRPVDDCYKSPLKLVYPKVNKEVFYSQHIGFNFLPEIKKILIMNNAIFASHFDYYFNSSKSLWQKIKMILAIRSYQKSPEKLHKKVVHAYENSTPSFFRDTWNIFETDLYLAISRIHGKRMTLSERFFIQTEKLEIDKISGDGKFEVPIPMSHIGAKQIQCRLMSNTIRQGMLGRLHNSQVNMNSKSLIFYIHGGGYIAQTSLTGEAYLGEISREIDAPIAAIDYTLGLDAPYPRALEETFYTYCWILKHPEFFGSTLERIVFISDSAGGQIAIGCALKCIENNIRPPDRLVNAYGIVEGSWMITPSRFLSVFDPILPFSLMIKIVVTYLTTEAQRAENELNGCGEYDVKIANDIYLNPFAADDNILRKFPAFSMVISSYDPFFDENLELAKKLNRLDVEVSLKVLKSVPHAFLNFAHVSPECRKGLMDLIGEIKKSIIN